MATNGIEIEKEPMLRIKPARRTKPADKEIFDVEVRVARVSITGTSPLIQNRFHGVDDMEAERGLDAEERRALKKAPKRPVVPEQRYSLARIVDSEGRDCVEASKIKASLVTASARFKDIGIPSTVIRGAVFVMGDLIPIQHKGIKIWKEAKPFIDVVPPMGLPRMRRDIVRVGSFGNRQPDLRYRPEFQNWSVNLEIEFEPSLITIQGLHLLLRRAGRSIGLYEWRPEKSPAGIFGRFDVTEALNRTRVQ